MARGWEVSDQGGERYGGSIYGCVWCREQGVASRDGRGLRTCVECCGAGGGSMNRGSGRELGRAGH